MKIFLRLFFSLVLIGGVTNGALAQKQLTGEISGNYQAGEYLISGDIVVLPKTTLSFAPGSVLRFMNYTGIMVQGRFVCNGTPQQPVVFTSVHDVPHTKTMPDAYDWNGIKVTYEAESISLEHCTIAYSTFGLNIESNTTQVSLKNIAFIHNGSASLTRAKKLILVQETTPVSFNWPEMTTVTTEADDGQRGPLAYSGKQADTHKEASPGSIGTDKTDKYRHGRYLRRITFGLLTAGSGAIGVLFQVRSNTLYDDYKADNNYNTAKHDAEWQSVRNAEKMRNIFYTLAGLSAAAFAISIKF
ncbi:MAG: hypothetical protein ABSF80_11520 [Chitinispirillaceae bacterium]|jgi:hypothetical protein